MRYLYPLLFIFGCSVNIVWMTQIIIGKKMNFVIIFLTYLWLTLFTIGGLKTFGIIPSRSFASEYHGEGIISPFDRFFAILPNNVFIWSILVCLPVAYVASFYMMARGKWFKILGVQRIGFQRILKVLYGMNLISLVVNSVYYYDFFYNFPHDRNHGLNVFPQLNSWYLAYILYTIISFFIFNIIIKIFTKIKRTTNI